MTAPTGDKDATRVTSDTTHDAPLSARIRKIWAASEASLQSPKDTIQLGQAPTKEEVEELRNTLRQSRRRACRKSFERAKPDERDTDELILDSKDKTGGGLPARLKDADPGSGDHILLGQDAFTVSEQIGQGGMGLVFSAEQASLGREVAIKTLENENGEWSNEKAAFIREALTTGALSHPNIVPVHLFGQDEQNMAYIVMKRVNGQPWSDLLRYGEKQRFKTGALAFDLSTHLEVFQKVCDAVAFAHAQGIIHRDLKPDNVMVGDFGEVTLMDWGLALVVTEKKDGPGARIGRDMNPGVAGSPAYMAPEMVMARNDLIGSATDIYLLGATLYEVLSGKPPHLGNTLFEVLKHAASGQIEKLELREGLPKDALELERVVLRCMAHDPEMRFSSVAEVQEAVRRFQVRQGDRTESNALARQARVAQDRLAKKVAHAEDPTPYYPHCSDILALTRLALKLWGFNPRAIRVQQECLALYANLAVGGRDWGLAESLLRDLKLTGTGGAGLATRIEKQLYEQRTLWQKREYMLRRTARAAALVMVFTAGLSIHLYWTWRNAQDRLEGIQTTVPGSPGGRAETPFAEPPGNVTPPEKVEPKTDTAQKDADDKSDPKPLLESPANQIMPPLPEPAQEEKTVFAPLVRPVWFIPIPGATGLVLGEGKPALVRELLRGPNGQFLFWDDEGRSWKWEGGPKGDRPPPWVPLMNHGFKGRVIRAAWVDDRRLVLADAEGVVRVGDSPDRPWNIVFRAKKRIKNLAAWRHAGDISIAIVEEQQLWLVSARGEKPKNTTLDEPVLVLAFKNDGALIAVTASNVWRDPFSKEPSRTPHGVALESANLFDEERFLVGVPAHDPGALVLARLDAHPPTALNFRLEHGQITDFAATPNGKRVVVASTEGELVLVDGESVKPLARGRVQGRELRGLSIDVTGRIVYSLDPQGGIHMWDVSGF